MTVYGDGPYEATNNEVQVALDGAVATLTINRPAKLNTITPAMGLDIARAVDALNRNDAVRVVVVTGAGDRAFSAGSDVSALDEYGSAWQLRNRVDYAKSVGSLRKPTVAAVRGYAIGGGLEIALLCDVRVAATDAQFSAGEVKLGWHGGAGETQLLPRLVGYGNAALMLLTGDMLSADEALRIGLVQRVVAPEVLLQEASALAEKIAANAPIATQYIKHLIRTSMDCGLSTGLQYENDTFVSCLATEDAAEGVRAFMERRTPVFRGR